MGVYLPNVDMPKDCMGCQFGVDGLCVAMNPARTRNWSAKETTNYCPLVPVPPHGDLVDRSEMREIAISLLDKAVTDQEANAIREMWSRLGQMTVYIPAEEEP